MALKTVDVTQTATIRNRNAKTAAGLI
jgi:hypothetical protein